MNYLDESIENAVRELREWYIDNKESVDAFVEEREAGINKLLETYDIKKLMAIEDDQVLVDAMVFKEGSTVPSLMTAICYDEKFLGDTASGDWFRFGCYGTEQGKYYTGTRNTKTEITLPMAAEVCRNILRFLYEGLGMVEGMAPENNYGGLDAELDDITDGINRETPSHLRALQYSHWGWTQKYFFMKHPDLLVPLFTDTTLGRALNYFGLGNGFVYYEKNGILVNVMKQAELPNIALLKFYNDVIDSAKDYDEPLLQKRFWKINHSEQYFTEEDYNRFANVGENGKYYAVVSDSLLGHLAENSKNDFGKMCRGAEFRGRVGKGEYVVICYSNSVRILGQIVGEWEKVNPKETPSLKRDKSGDWYAAEIYCIKTSKKIDKHISNPDNWPKDEAYVRRNYQAVWSPEYGSVFGDVVLKEEQIFEKEILIPCFGLTLDQIRKLDYTDIGIIIRNKKINSMPLNRIVFGAPGTGKSFFLNEEKNTLLDVLPTDSVEIKRDKEKAFERVTFHPDYTYAKFVGTYKPVPKADDKISYEYVPGPFMRLLVKALTNRNQKYLLLIEEINRANVAAVFGDVFQLLDRDDNGKSEYPIQTSEDMRKYLEKALVGISLNSKQLYIPENMYIWASMNSADQGVFPMDTAFKRRWEFEYIGIDDGEDKLDDAVISISGEKIYWNVLRKAINEELSENHINEDKLMGPFFMKKSFFKTGVSSEKVQEAFKAKVIMYLFEDAAKQKRDVIFNKDENKVLRYSALCDEFSIKGIQIFHNNILTRYNNELHRLGLKQEAGDIEENDD